MLESFQILTTIVGLWFPYVMQKSFKHTRTSQLRFTTYFDKFDDLISLLKIACTEDFEMLEDIIL